MTTKRVLEVGWKMLCEESMAWMFLSLVILRVKLNFKLTRLCGCKEMEDAFADIPDIPKKGDKEEKLEDGLKIGFWV